MKKYLALLTLGFAAMTHAATWYVDANRPNDTGAGTAWATAKRSIRAAIDVAGAGDTVVVTNGVYAPIVTDDKAIVIRNVTECHGGRTGSHGDNTR
ncbi:MAG: hypothetical protein FWF84_03260, partial [Kiritimatiellaeota bacterium]|nr:hypothetical protein [Kiritimatiellota bacterium]